MIIEKAGFLLILTVAEEGIATYFRLLTYRFGLLFTALLLIASTERLSQIEHQYVQARNRNNPSLIRVGIPASIRS
jgi:hypothetical protein